MCVGGVEVGIPLTLIFQFLLFAFFVNSVLPTPCLVLFSLLEAAPGCTAQKVLILLQKRFALVGNAKRYLKCGGNPAVCIFFGTWDKMREA